MNILQYIQNFNRKRGGRAFLLCILFIIGLTAGIVIGFFVRFPCIRPDNTHLTLPLHHGTATPDATGGQVRLNGKYTGIIVEGDNMVPLHALMEALGGSATWSDATRQITIVYDNHTIEVRPNIRTASVNKRQTYLSSPLRIISDRAMVSLDFMTRYMELGLGFIHDTVVVTTETACQVPVLVYHHILPRDKSGAMPNNPWLVTTENFEEQMRYLQENGFYAITLCDIENFLLHGRNLPARSVMIHFDDGYYSNFVYAAPIMQQYGMRGQIFLITAEIEALGNEQPPLDYSCLTFSAAVTIAAGTDVFETASHSHNLHDRVYGSTDTRLMRAMRDDIIADTIQSFKFVQNHRAYVFPLAQYNEYVVNALQDAGIIMAFIGGDTHVTRYSNPFALPRFSVYNATSLREFRNMVR